MENAADALRIAAGVLIAILLISLFIMVFNRISNVEEERSKQELITQITQFNAKFNAFDKSSMYGTDLISVLGLAYSNNMEVNRVNSKHPDGRYDANLDGSINIEFKLTTDIYEMETTKVYKVVNGIQTLVSTKKVQGKKIFKNNTVYSLANDNDEMENIKNIVIDGNTTKVETKRITSIETKETTTDTYGFSELKQNIFKCTKIGYTDAGRINYMRFEQIK